MLYCRIHDDDQYLTPDDLLVKRTEEELNVKVSENDNPRGYSVKIQAQPHSVQYTSVTLQL